MYINKALTIEEPYALHARVIGIYNNDKLRNLKVRRRIVVCKLFRDFLKLIYLKNSHYQFINKNVLHIK